MKNAFTLAETLVTLGIIGIVAAMTIPNMVANYKANILHTQLVKAYSILQQALQKMQNDTGMIANRTNYKTQEFINTFRPYFLSFGNCKTRSCVTQSYTDKNGSIQSISTDKYKTYNNTTNVSTNLFDDGQIIIGDGMFIMIENYTSEILITIDINGLYQKPNRWGHDLFTFQVDEKTGKLLPMGAPNTKYGQTYCSTTSNNTYNGIACTYKALTEKDYFKNLPK